MTARIAAIAAFVLTAFSVVAAAPSGLAPEASARCLGVGNPTAISLYSGSTRVAYEAANSGTCDNLRDYYGVISDTYRDGSCVRVIYRDGGYTGTQGVDCTDPNSPYSYRFFDQTGDSSASFSLCTDYVCVSGSTYGY